MSQEHIASVFKAPTAIEEGYRQEKAISLAQ
jgi:hypothetical protein